MAIAEPRGLLIVNPFGIGDVLFTTPLIRALRQAFPQSHLGYLCNRRTERVLWNNPHLSELFIYEKDEMVQRWRQARRCGLAYVRELLRRIRRARFDVAIDLSLGERYAFILQCLGIPRRIGFDYRRRGRFLTERFLIEGYHDEHVVEYYRAFLRFMGIHLLDHHLQLATLPADDQWAEAWLQRHGIAQAVPLVGIVPAGGVSWGIDAPFRRWSLEGFAAVADALVRRYGASIILFGEATDAGACQTVARLMRSSAIDVSGQTSLGQFISLLRRLTLVLCNDGGPLHLAVSQDVKTVSIFGPVDPQVYGPHPSLGQRHHVVYRAELPCRPCYHRFKLPPCPYERACLTFVTPEEVLEACDDALLDSRRAVPSPMERHGPPVER